MGINFDPSYTISVADRSTTAPFKTPPLAAASKRQKKWNNRLIKIPVSFIFLMETILRSLSSPLVNADT